ncbi:MAG: FCD domain-containing protein [Lachnospiraceae bacterium]|nr:FCD domain-containing protein [Lachnospiraceae bacterium]
MATAISLQNLLNIQPQKNVSDVLYDQISQLIRSGDLPEGYTFPNEIVLCEQLSVGRSSIREAYKALELSGYVTRTKKGTVVNSTSKIIRATPLKTVARNSSAQDFAEFRLMLESKTAALAARRATLDEVEKLQSIQDSLAHERKQENYELMNQLDREFHLTIASASHNPLMVNSMEAIIDTWETETAKNFIKADASLLDKTLSTHQSILVAIRERNPEEASRLMEQHVTEVSV